MIPDAEAALTAAIVRLATRCGRLRLPPYHRVAAGRGLAREPQAGGADLATGGAQGAPPLTQTTPPVADRRVLYPPTAHASPSHMGL